MEGRGAANGKLTSRNALSAQDEAGALTSLERVGQHPQPEFALLSGTRTDGNDEIADLSR
jgi:hypothetical protein